MWIRGEILRNEFRRPVVTPAPGTAEYTTLDHVMEMSLERYKPRKARDRAVWARETRRMLAKLTAFTPSNGQRLGETPIGSITEDSLEAFMATLADRAASTRNHYVQHVKALFRWAARKGYIDKTPISDESDLRREQSTKRNRRLAPREESALLAVAGDRLQRLIIAAVESGARLGELLKLRLHESMRKIEEARSRCNPAANEAEIGGAVPPVAPPQSAGKSLVN